MSQVQSTESPSISDELTNLGRLSQKLSDQSTEIGSQKEVGKKTFKEVGGEAGREARWELLKELSENLTIHEVASLISMVHERDSEVGKGKRFGLFPIEDWDAFYRSKVLEASTWHADEVEFAEDRNDFLEFTKEEQKPLIRSFGFFAVGDGSIASMLAYRLILAAPTFEKQQFYVIQLDNERVHGETYGRMIYSLISDPKEREDIFNSVENIESIKEMNELIEKGFTIPDGERELYIMLAAAEYLMFTPLFCIIFWYRAYKPGKIPQIIFSNRQIAKDEASHCMNGCANYLCLDKKDRYTDEEVWKIIDQFVQAVSKFADEALEDVHLEELTPENVKQYIKFVADDLLDRVNHKPLYNVSSPFTWMDYTNLIPKTNFYEGTVSEYTRFNPKNSVTDARELISGEFGKKANAYQEVDQMKF